MNRKFKDSMFLFMYSQDINSDKVGLIDTPNNHVSRVIFGKAGCYLRDSAISSSSTL